MKGSQNRTSARARGIACALVLLLPLVAGVAAVPAVLDARRADVPKQVALIVEPGRLLASNIRLNRIDPHDLEAGEELVARVEARAALAAVTGTRILAYGPVIGWRELALLPDEQLEDIRAEDFAVFIITNRRYLNFNADSGIWGQQPRPAP